MKAKNSNSTGISEVVSVILVIALVVALSIVVYVLISGQLDPKYMQKSVYVAGEANVKDIVQPSGLNDQILAFLPKNGDPFYLTGQSLDIKGTQVSLKIYSPDGKILSPNASELSGSLYGKTLFLYPNNSASSTVCDIGISDKVPSGYLRPMVTGRYTIKLIDEKTHILANTYTLDVKDGTSSLPVAGGFITPGKIYRSDCTEIISTVTGSLPTSTTGPGNMTFTTFTGSPNFLTIANDPSVTFTGDMAISMWLRPTTAGNSNDPSTWHQIVGKGSISGTTENDNYQLFQIGDKLVFEWNDATNPTIHYQAITDSTITAGNWNYVTASISGGTISISNNGVPQDLVYSQGVDPRSINPPVPYPPPVNLQSTPNDVTVGKQNGVGNEFYYVGDIGAVSLYNRPLTTQEINANLNSYTA